MFWKFVTILLFGGVSVFSQPAFSQSGSLEDAKLNVKVSPQYLFINGVHFEIERRLASNNRHSLIFSPRYYFGKTETVDFFAGRRSEIAGSEVIGGGAEIQHRIYLSKDARITDGLIYIAYGLNYHAFNISFRQLGWEEEPGTDGLFYYKYRKRDYKEKVNRWGGSLLLGTQNAFLTDQIFHDIYIGFGYYSSNNRSDYRVVRYNKNIMDFGKNGLGFLAGIKLGFWI